MAKASEQEAVLLKVQELLNKVKFGSITLIIQDGVVIQIEQNEKIRLK
nr:YezD family protein [Mesobacillus campisalis]